ncbi:uncharacterized protein LOC121530409 [Drosophila eugracilis]|uniref:uncharacterized protein LOC121530409 n=1 Tax=Drosophila eugracilis TaxID=29029 RepID=UPI001BD9F718|nr:uncharacterized protein LOC121530409 [Drosophila eugracilis]
MPVEGDKKPTPTPKKETKTTLSSPLPSRVKQVPKSASPRPRSSSATPKIRDRPTTGSKTSPRIVVSKPVAKASSESSLVEQPENPSASGTKFLRVTRASKKMSVAEQPTAATAALHKFIAVSDRVSAFEDKINTPGQASQSSHTFQVHLQQVRALWEKVEKEYEICSDLIAQEGSLSTLPLLQAKYDYCYSVYATCAAQISETLDRVTPQADPALPSQPLISSGCRLPPCDTEVFDGDYLRWPTFRDLFTAVYVNNPRLTPVEKLFHLLTKTSGEAKAIVSKSPLTNDGFASAWAALQDRFQNKRLLVNSQLKLLFNLSSISQESGHALKELQSTIQGCLTALAHSNISTDNWDCLLVFLCASKLPKLTLSLWEQSLTSKSEIPAWEEMNTFLSERYRTLEAIEDMKPTQSVPKRLQSFETKVTPKQKGCDLCSKENHPIRLCPRFLNMSVDARSGYIKKKQLCLNCFARGHQLRDCTSTHSCFTCRGRHHTLLHRGSPSSSSTTSSNARPTSSPTSAPSAQQSSSRNASASTSTVQNYFAANTTAVLLSTAIVDVCHLGTSYRARALFDSGSEATFISERMFKLLKLPFRKTQTQVSGLNQSVSAESTRLCQFAIRSPTKPGLQLDTAAYVLPELAGKLPSHPVPRNSLQDLPDLQWADPNFFESSQIDLLIGADILPSVMMQGTRRNICGSLLGQETIFGWVLTGPISNTKANRVASFTTQVHHQKEDSLDSLLSKFWEVEDLPFQMVKESDSYCERNFLRTTKRDASGRYVVTLPFCDPENSGSDLGYSRSIALAQFLRNENRLKRDFPLKEQYDSVIQEYLDLGHMHEVPSTHSSPTYYLPHHAVIKPESTTTKLRVVFNASSPSANGTSLNDILHAGPVLQSDLTIQILKWRYFQYVFSADITKMYRQIWVDPKHTPFQRILFRDKEGDIRDFELKTVTFGVNCAPFLAIRVLQQIAEDVQGAFPKASHILQQHMYVDDVLAGANSISEAHSSIQELQAALSSAGFPLRKWTSNHTSILQNIPAEHLLHSEFLDIDTESTAKTLGIRWRAKSDEFYFVPPEIVVEPSFTKREVLSQIARLFDPAGWLAPFIIRSKMFMQEIWLQDFSWDDKLPSEMSQRWQAFLHEYSDLNQIRVPRWVCFQPEIKVAYHGFCDASQKAYGAAIYVRVEVGQKILSNLLTSKTRVAPVKTVSLPRLELCGAVLLAEMVTAILPNMPTPSSDIRCWTDSTIVLAWLRKPACNWTTFVANRVAKITQAVPVDCWAHVRSEQNSADLASRGVSLLELADSQLWWHGPEWLQGPQELWPAQSIVQPNTELEQRAVKVHFSQVPSDEFLERFSKLDKALRVLAYVRRFLSRCRKGAISSTSRPTREEIREAEQTLISIAQRRAYGQELKHLAEKKPLPGASPILNLFPFTDQLGLLRACGRVTASRALQYDERHPIILPYGCRLSRLLVQFTHQITLHGGSQLIVRLIRSKYWIPKLKNLVKAVVNPCKICTIYKKRLQTQLMGDLPKDRVSFSRPFTYTGIDYAGPFEIKNYTGRACLITKGYVCVFVCFSTKAIHLEPTSDLTAEKFLAAFARFVARRGCPRRIHSDNGKTFVGAASLLSRDFLQAVKESVTDVHSHQGLDWRFIPPGAPHMGGLWEAGVKSFKTLFYKATATRKYTFEELATLLAKIEACLNSRPLSPMSEDPSDLLALTPGHFLIGGPLLSTAEPEIKGEAKSIINRWQHLKAQHQQFSARWKEEYLKELHKRNKWQFPTRNIKIDDMVVVKEDNLPSNEWRLGRIVSVFPGADGRVRVAEVRTARGTIKRPVHKVILLPMESKEPATSSH